jgi:hypothetical protein
VPTWCCRRSSLGAQPTESAIILVRCPILNASLIERAALEFFQGPRRRPLRVTGFHVGAATPMRGPPSSSAPKRAITALCATIEPNTSFYARVPGTMMDGETSGRWERVGWERVGGGDPLSARPALLCGSRATVLDILASTVASTIDEFLRPGMNGS